MEIFINYLCTILLSYGLDLITAIQMYKDIADRGYKFNSYKTDTKNQEFTDEEQNNIENDRLYHLIPLLNIFNSMMKAVNYLNVREELLNQMYYSGAIEEMSEREKEEYSKHPNGLNAMVIATKTAYKLARSSKVSIQTGLYRGDIYYTATDDLEEINIIKVTGSLSRLTEEEQQDKVREVLMSYAESVMKEFFSTADFEELLKESDTVIVQKVMTDGTVEEMSNEEKRKVLEDFKRELLGETVQQEENLNEHEEGPKLTKKK